MIIEYLVTRNPGSIYCTVTELWWLDLVWPWPRFCFCCSWSGCHDSKVRNGSCLFFMSDRCSRALFSCFCCCQEAVELIYTGLHKRPIGIFTALAVLVWQFTNCVCYCIIVYRLTTYLSTRWHVLVRFWASAGACNAPLTLTLREDQFSASSSSDNHRPSDAKWGRGLIVNM